jgi:ketosteroid isomerase-like protein
VSDGTRTRDRRDHNPELYQLSYAHQDGLESSGSEYCCHGMSDANVAIAREALNAFNSGDIEALMRLSREDIRIHATERMPNAGEFVGEAGYRTWTERWLEAWETFTVELLDADVYDEGRFVVARALQRGKGRGSGVEIEMEVFHLWELRDGRIAQFHLYISRDDALAALAAAR